MTDTGVVLLAMCPCFMLNMGWRKESKGGSGGSACSGKWEMFRVGTPFRRAAPGVEDLGVEVEIARVLS